MSRVQKLQNKIEDATLKLHERQKDVEYWMKEIRQLTEELTQAQQEEADQASHKKIA